MRALRSAEDLAHAPINPDSFCDTVMQEQLFRSIAPANRTGNTLPKPIRMTHTDGFSTPQIQWNMCAYLAAYQCLMSTLHFEDFEVKFTSWIAGHSPSPSTHTHYLLIRLSWVSTWPHTSIVMMMCLMSAHSIRILFHHFVFRSYFWNCLDSIHRKKLFAHSSKSVESMSVCLWS